MKYFLHKRRGIEFPLPMQGDFHLDGWLVQPSLARISKAGHSVHVRAKVMDLLVYLARHQGEVINKDVLLDAVWGTNAISESALTRTVTELRQALEDDVEEPRYIGTIAKRGYRLIAPVSDLPPASAAGSEAVRFEEQQKLTGVWRTRRAVMAVAVGIVVFGTGIAASLWKFGPSQPPPIPVVAVLPFEYRSSAVGDEHLAHGLHQELTSRLAMIGGLKVIDRHSVLRYGNDRSSIPTAAKDLGAEFILRGTLIKDAKRIQFIPVLTDVRDAGDQWTDHYDRDLSIADLTSIQSEVALRVAEALRVKISSAERGRISGRGTVNATAYDLFLRAGQLSYENDEKERLLKEAITLDPGFAAAVAELAQLHINRSYFLGQPGANTDRGLEYAQWAIELDPGLPAAHRALGMAYLDKGNLRAASTAYSTLLQLQPSDGDALLFLGWIDWLSGRMPEAIDRWMAARTLSPFNTLIYIDLQGAERLLGNERAAEHWSAIADKLGGRPNARIRALLYAGKTDEAVLESQRLVSTNPRSIQALEAFAEASIRTRSYAQARKALEEMDRVATNDWNFWGFTYRTWYGYVLLRSGARNQGLQVLERTRKDAMARVTGGDERPAVKREIAAIHAARGERAEAYLWMERAIADGWRLEPTHPSPLFESIQTEPEFQRLVQLINDEISKANAEVERRGLRNRSGS